MENIQDIAEDYTGLKGQEALFAFAVAVLKEYQLGIMDENNQIKQVTLEEAEQSLDATLSAIKDNITGE